MGKYDKLRQKILLAESDANIPFDALCQLLKRMGFQGRVKGSHHIFWLKGVEEIINLQPNGSKAKSYQVAQIRDLMIKYKLSDDANE